MDNSNDENRKQKTIDISQELLAEIKAGDIDHGLSVAQMLLSEGPKFAPELLIVLIESVVELCAQAGSQDAKDYLNDTWPTLKRAHLRRLTGNQGPERPD